MSDRPSGNKGQSIILSISQILSILFKKRRCIILSIPHNPVNPVNPVKKMVYHPVNPAQSYQSCLKRYCIILFEKRTPSRVTRG